MRHLLAASLALASLLPLTAMTTLNAASGERTLYLHYTHTNETTRITFRRNGRYDQAGLNKLNQFLRDWRRNEPTRMDPALFDLLWSVYQEVGATEPINIVSAYRSPQTNEMLRSRSGGVAKNSRHTMGMAIDFFIPGVAISKVREAAMRHQVGGVGYYPTSRSPFVHLDTGNVRAWPRMTRTQLARLFPDGRTLHLPSDGVPLSAEGRRYAAAEWERCRSVPCVGTSANTAPTRSESGGTLFDLFFGNNRNDEAATTAVASSGPARRNVTAVAVNSTPPIPAERAGFLDFRDPPAAPVPLEMPRSVYVATRTTSQALPDAAPIATQLDPITVASLSEDDRPAARTLLSQTPVPANLVTAYAPVTPPEPDAQRALQMLIERRNAATTPPPEPLPLRGSIVTASLGPPPGNSPPSAPAPEAVPPEPEQNDLSGLFDATFRTVADTPSQDGARDAETALAILAGAARTQRLPIDMRTVELVAPDLDHVADTMVIQSAVAQSHFAVMFEPDEGDFSPATELGPHSAQIYFSRLNELPLAADRFTRVAPVISAAI